MALGKMRLGKNNLLDGLVSQIMARKILSPSKESLHEAFRETFKPTKLEDTKMETKSRYEVISDLERQKRNLILERDNFKDEIAEKEQAVKELVREKADANVRFDRRLEDVEKELKDFKSNVDEKKETIKELIKSVEASLERFSKIEKKK